MKSRDLETALKTFREKGGTLRTRDLVALGVHTDALYALRDGGQIVELGRGLYRLAEAAEAEYPDLAVVAARAPNAAVTLVPRHHDPDPIFRAHCRTARQLPPHQAVNARHRISLRPKDVL